MIDVLLIALLLLLQLAIALVSFLRDAVSSI